MTQSYPEERSHNVLNTTAPNSHHHALARRGHILQKRIPADHKVCRNQCRYCGFRRDPAHPEANLMTADEVETTLAAASGQDAPKPSSRLGKCQRSIHYSGDGSRILATQA